MNSVIDKNLNSGPLAFKLKKCVDPRVDTEELNQIDNEYIGYVGAQNWNRYSIPANVYNPNEVKFTNIQSPGPNVLWDKKWWIEYLIDIIIKDIPGTNNNAYNFMGSDPAIFFRPYPLHQTTHSIQIRLNNRDIESFPMESLNQRMEYWPQDKLKLSCGCCPHRKYNGQTFADCSIRSGNAPYGDMKEFTDQDYPNSTLCNIEICEFTQAEMYEHSKFERTAPMKGYRVKEVREEPMVAGGRPGNPIPLKGIHSGVEYTIADDNLENRVAAKYLDMVAAFANYVKIKYPAGIPYTEINSVKDEFKNHDPSENNNGLGGKKIWNQNAVDSYKSDNDSSNVTIEVGTLLDADFLNDQEKEALKNYLVCDDKNGIVEYWCGTACKKKGSYHLRARIREPIIAEPLDFTSSSEFGRSMWNISHVEVKFAFVDRLKNMIAIDPYKLQKNCEWYWAYEIIKSHYTGNNQFILKDSNIDINFAEAPRLIYNIATPFVPPNCPFICAHKQFQRFESHIDEKLSGDSIDRRNFIKITNNTLKLRTTSDAYPLQFHPNAIYLWVAERNTDRYSDVKRYTRVDSYAKITGIRITYGNTSNILAQFDDHELFQMSLRNGLKDRTFLDWTAVPKSICVPDNYSYLTDYYGIGGSVPLYGGANGIVDDATMYLDSTTIDAENLITYQRYAGIGSVIKLIPGIDILTGDTTNPLVAGMHAYSATIKIEVDFIPLNINEKISYSLYTMFEYDGVCTINAHSCDLGMIAIESWAQLKATPKARTIREDAYGSGLGGAALHTSKLTNTIGKQFKKNSAEGSGMSGGAINENTLTSYMHGGRIISPQELSSNFRGKGGGSFYRSY